MWGTNWKVKGLVLIISKEGPEKDNTLVFEKKKTSSIERNVFLKELFCVLHTEESKQS